MYKEGNDFVNNTDKYKRDFARVLTLLMLLAALFVTDIPVSADTTDSATVSSISAVTEKAEIKASSNTALKISWEKCPLAQGYVIYRRESTRKAFRRIKKVSASRTSYIDKRLTSSKPYQYAVRAIRKENGKYVYSRYLMVTGATRPAIVKTRINYDILSYLPDSLETVKGQDIMVDQFGDGAYSMIIVEDMNLHDVQKLKQKLEKVNHVDKIIWYDDIADLSVPKEMLPEKVRKVFFNKNATMMIAMFKETTSSDNTMEAVTQMRKIVGKQCFISGMSGVVTDIKNLVMQEIPIYVTIAAVLSLIVLFVTMESFAVAFLFLLSIGMAILYNLGTNIFLSDVSYLTMALTAILQLGVTMDYSIFLLHSYESNKIRFEGDKERAMAHAIADTFKSVAGSSVTTILCFPFCIGSILDTARTRIFPRPVR